MQASMVCVCVCVVPITLATNNVRTNEAMFMELAIGDYPVIFFNSFSQTLGRLYKKNYTEKKTNGVQMK
jgi:hypothetical protein